MSGYGGLFRSAEEQIQPVDAIISGNIPEWINGDLIANGPGLFDLKKNFSVNHWLDGFAILSKFHIENGKVTFSKRFIQSDAYIKGTAAGNPLYTEFGTKAYTDPSKSMFQKMKSYLLPDLTDNVANNLYIIGNTLYGSTDTSVKRIIDPITLETRDKVDVAKSTKLDLVASHVYFDSDGACYGLGRSLSAGFMTQIFKIPPEVTPPGQEFSKATILATVPTRHKMGITFTHSLGMTENYLIYIEQPMYMPGMKLVAAYGKGKSMSECMEWRPKESNRFIIIHKLTGEVNPLIFESTQPFFFFHHINAYEQDRELIIDILCHESPEVIYKMKLKELRSSDFNLKDKSVARRFALPLITSFKNIPENKNLLSNYALPKSITAVRKGDKIILTDETLAPPSLELPMVNPAYFGKEYTYFYAPGLYDQSEFKNKLVKVDVKTGEVKTWMESTTSFPCEPCFLPSPNSKSEDDGVLLVNVSETNKELNSFLVILDAKDLNEIGRATLPVHSPFLIHSIFIPESFYSKQRT
ncbi:beta,beta-carotene 9',10'-oxygenase-like [Cimex lectularius]|uniref:Uncharacterized protein n=1 Tax=Cimex lectularius TaxID=79782 RepID=A0A8I6S0Z6_CIMLE|nr:beta,beta-carotene 9',10'-oxygenase-like [Cimex lectularius]